MDFSDVIARFGYARLAALIGRPEGTVSSWQTRNVLPPEHWTVIVTEAERLGFEGITHQSLADMAARRAADRGRRVAPAPEAA